MSCYSRVEVDRWKSSCEASIELDAFGRRTYSRILIKDVG